MHTPRLLPILIALSLPLAAAASCSSSSSGNTGGAGGQGSTSASTSATTSTSTGSTSSTGTGGMQPDGGDVDKSKDCASTFGNALTSSYGRVDGTVLAVVQPGDMKCPMPNNDHLILEVTMSGAAYRMVVNMQSTSGDPNVQYLSLAHALPAPAWSEGWHTGLSLDYVNDLGVHAAGFTPHPMAELAKLVTDAITVGSKISVYASSSGGASAHLIHRNTTNADGAIVIDPDGAAPQMLLFHFADQTF